VDSDVVRIAGKRDDVDFRKLEAVSLKGIASPVEVYEALPI
jgi:class 3 adenylate cyclase